MKRRYAFSLPEILISVVILGLVMTSVMTLFSSVFTSYEFHQDISEAKQRGQIALAAMQPYAVNAGLGLPPSESSFATAFSPLLGTGRILENFSSSVQLADSGGNAGDGEGEQVWLVFAVPSGAGVNFEYELPAGTDAVMTEADGQIENIASLFLSETATDIKSWVAFPGSTAPFRTIDLDQGAKSLVIRSALAQTICAFDEIHYVRAVKIRVNGMRLEINHLDNPGWQPAVDGVEAMWCTFDPDGDRVLTVTVLARADTRHNEEFQGTVEGWPAAAPQPADRHYRYAAVTRSWRIRN